MATRQARDSMAGRWAAVAQIVVALGEELSIEGLVGRTLDQALVVLGADAAGLYVVNTAERRLNLIAERGLPPDLVDEIAVLNLDDSTLVGKAALTAEFILVNDLASAKLVSPLARELVAREGFRSLAAVPLRAHGQVVGVIACATRDQRRFDREELAVIEVVAHALAAGIMNARAFEAERRLRVALQAADEATLAIASELEPRRVLQAIVERAREVGDARYAALGIGTDTSKPFEPWVFSGLDVETAKSIGPYPRPVGLLGAVPFEGRVIRTRDLKSDPRFHGWPAHHPTMTSFLGMPIRLRGEAIGNLYLTDKIGADEFSIEDEQAVSALASHAAVAYRHAQLYQEAQTQRRRLTAVVENSPLAIIFIEAGTGYTYANKAAEELFGGSIEPATGQGRYAGQIMRPGEAQGLAIEELPSSRALKGEPVVGMEVVIRRPDGSEVPVIANAAPILGEGDRVSGAVVLWQDVSPLKLEQLREEFISLVAHELRTPIAVISGYADLLARAKQGESEQRAISSIRVSTKRLERLVQDLLDASRIEARRLTLELRLVDLNTLVKDVVDRMRQLLSGHPVTVDVAEGNTSIEADTIRVEQVLTNLLTNAAKYSLPGTSIGVSVRVDDGMVVAAVRNEGPSIPAEDQPRLFTRFYRVRSGQGGAPGLGLGLYIARGLMEAQGGRIWVDSHPDRGTTFYIAFPKSPLR